MKHHCCLDPEVPGNDLQARAVQNADELASHKDLLQVEVDALRQEMANVKGQLTEQQVCLALLQG